MQGTEWMMGLLKTSKLAEPKSIQLQALNLMQHFKRGLRGWRQI